MKNYLISFLTIFILVSCDAVEDFAAETLKSKTMKGYLQCMENNKEEISILGYEFVTDECAKKHSKKSSSSTGISPCRASVATGSNPSVEIGTCNNNTQSVITSLKVSIAVKNIPNDSYISITSKHKSMFIKPNQNIKTKILIDSSKFNDYPNLPHCSYKPDEVCKSWFIKEYSYIPANIN
ncbi:hypothetical protein OAB41_04585 [Gammaproteobacteria bacterium]|nr:hypothetical protein [Gammaproteobacteria bacterium]